MIDSTYVGHIGYFDGIWTVAVEAEERGTSDLVSVLQHPPELMVNMKTDVSPKRRSKQNNYAVETPQRGSQFVQQPE